jgi:hypothetical protein
VAGYTLNPDGTTSQSAKFEYQASDKRTWILKSARLESFSKDGRFGVILALKLDKFEKALDISERTFGIDFPEGTFVRDQVRDRHYKVR